MLTFFVGATLIIIGGFTLSIMLGEGGPRHWKDGVITAGAAIMFFYGLHII